MCGTDLICRRLALAQKLLLTVLTSSLLQFFTGTNALDEATTMSMRLPTKSVMPTQIRFPRAGSVPAPEKSKGNRDAWSQEPDAWLMRARKPDTPLQCLIVGSHREKRSYLRSRREKNDRNTRRRRRLGAPRFAPHPTRPGRRGRTARCSNSNGTAQRASSGAGRPNKRDDRRKNDRIGRRYGGGTAAQREMETESRLTAQETSWMQATHAGCRDGRRATTARVAKALECDAGTLHCSDNPHCLRKQRPEKHSVKRQFSSHLTARVTTTRRRPLQRQRQRRDREQTDREREKETTASSVCWKQIFEREDPHIQIENASSAVYAVQNSQISKTFTDTQLGGPRVQIPDLIDVRLFVFSIW